MTAVLYASFAARGELAHVELNPWPPANLRELVLAQDVIYVSGGSTANALAIWRVHGFDADGEARRRPVYTELVRDGFPPGIACDDAAAVLYEGAVFVEVVARADGARAYRVGADGEQPLDVTRRR